MKKGYTRNQEWAAKTAAQIELESPIGLRGEDLIHRVMVIGKLPHRWAAEIIVEKTIKSLESQTL